MWMRNGLAIKAKLGLTNPASSVQFSPVVRFPRPHSKQLLPILSLDVCVCVCAVAQVLEDVTGEEFVLLMRILSGLKNLQTVSGRQQLVELVVEQAFLEQALNPADADAVDRLLQCTRQALPLFSVSVPLMVWDFGVLSFLTLIVQCLVFTHLLGHVVL